MSGWEYKIVPAPKKGIKGVGVKGPEGRFVHAIEALMNEMGAQGWEYQRAETLPSVERSGLTSTTTEWRNLLVFRRVVVAPLDDFEPELLPAPIPAPVPVDLAKDVATQSAPEPQTDITSSRDTAETAKTDVPRDVPAAKQDVAPEAETSPEAAQDNGVEDTSDIDGVTTSLEKLVAQRKILKSAD